MVYEQTEILDNIRSYNEKLYKSREPNLVDIELGNLLNNYNIPKLDNDTANGLEHDILESEVFSVLKKMKNNISPGSDGYTVEFFKFFWKDLKLFIIKAINCIFYIKKLPISKRLGIISCLPKGDKPRQYLKNWRPITLLNVLYKIISGCLSHRIKDTLDHIISETQSGFLKRRYIGENTRFIYDILSFTELHNIPG